MQNEELGLALSGTRIWRAANLNSKKWDRLLLSTLRNLVDTTPMRALKERSGRQISYQTNYTF